MYGRFTQVEINFGDFGNNFYVELIKNFLLRKNFIFLTESYTPNAQYRRTCIEKF